MSAVLEAEGLEKAYGETTALAGLDVHVEHGELVVLLGPNGAGKTTLFRLLTGLSLPDVGTVRIDGFDIRRQRTAALGRIGVVFQQPTVDLEMSVWRNLNYHALLHGIPRAVREQCIEKALHDVRLSDQARAKMRNLSGGNRRRVELARSLLHEPRLLLMDEPTVGLDPESRRDLLVRVDALRRDQRIGVLWATHLVDEAARADRVVILHKGHELASQPPAQLLARTGTRDLSDAFLALTNVCVEPPGVREQSA